MVASTLIGMLCLHLLCFSVMFLLICSRLDGKKMGMDVFAVGNVMLALAYIMQLLEGGPTWSAMSLLNHTLTLTAPVMYVLGIARFFSVPLSVPRTLAVVVGGYTAAQLLVQWALGGGARHALLALSCAVLFLSMMLLALHSRRTFAKDLSTEMLVIAFMLLGIGGLNAAKFVIIWRGGLEALDLSSRFQTVFYLYMSFLGTVIPPTVIWLAMRRFSDELRALAVRDPLTQLLNRRGLMDGLNAHFRARNAGPAHLLIVDIDHFKSINDTHGHKVGDMVLSRVASILQSTTREGDLTCRLGGEEFVLIAPNTDAAGAVQLAERARAAVAASPFPSVSLHGEIRCTITVGVSAEFGSVQTLDAAMQQADAALYRGKAAGRNRVEWAFSASLSGTEVPVQSAAG